MADEQRQAPGQPGDEIDRGVVGSDARREPLEDEGDLADREWRQRELVQGAEAQAESIEEWDLGARREDDQRRGRREPRQRVEGGQVLELIEPVDDHHGAPASTSERRQRVDERVLVVVEVDR